MRENFDEHDTAKVWAEFTNRFIAVDVQHILQHGIKVFPTTVGTTCGPIRYVSGSASADLHATSVCLTKILVSSD
jgi:hypothetical protein